MNELIDSYMKHGEDNISPLLTVYDKVKENTKLMLPSKTMLEQD